MAHLKNGAIRITSQVSPAWSLWTSCAIRFLWKKARFSWNYILYLFCNRCKIFHTLFKFKDFARLYPWNRLFKFFFSFFWVKIISFSNQLNFWMVLQSIIFISGFSMHISIAESTFLYCTVNRCSFIYSKFSDSSYNLVIPGLSSSFHMLKEIQPGWNRVDPFMNYKFL